MYFRCLMLCGLAVCLTACGSRDEALAWPELKALDHEVAELDGVLATDSPTPNQLADQVQEVLNALDALQAADLPDAVNNRELVEQKLEELAALGEDIRSGLTQTGLDTDSLGALHPLVASIMEEAGMPHVHDEMDHDHEDKAADHDHKEEEDHDEDHDGDHDDENDLEH